MGYNSKQLGPACVLSNWFGMDDGTLALTNTGLPGLLGLPFSQPVLPAHPASGVTGDIGGLQSDFLAYLDACGQFFGVVIFVTSGLRDGDAQAHAMFNNWLKLDRGKVYAKAALSDANRTLLDGYYTTALETPTATPAQKSQAKEKFLDLAKNTKSRHSTGRAADIRLSSINAKVHRALLVHLREVKEGKRKDIIHVESTHVVPPVDDALRKKWEHIRDEQAMLLPHESKLDEHDTCIA